MGKEPKFKTIEAHGKIELREYGSFLVAEVEVEGERKEAIRAGFRLLAAFIFGANATKTKIAMKIPVTQQKAADHWKIRFMLPSEYSEETIPQPNSSRIKIDSIEKRRFAAIRFSGTPSDIEIDIQTHKLTEFCLSHQWQISGSPIFAFYNPPWTIPCFRRNEVMFEIKS
jgi:hypothetical protein